MTRQELVSLKERNPLKYLEILPYELAVKATEKLVSRGIVPKNKDVYTVTSYFSKRIADIMSSPINIKHLTLGGIIYIIGREIYRKEVKSHG